MIKLDGHSGLLVRAEHLLGAEATPRSGCRCPDVEFVGGAGGYNLVKGTLVYE